MAAELAAGYVSLTVKLAKGGMADVTKEVKKAGKEGGETYSDEFNKQVGKDVGKNLPDTIGKATKKGGGLGKAAKDAADEFGKGFREGIDQSLDKSDIGKSVEDAFSKRGMGKAAKTAAEEFGKGLRDGIKDAIEEHGGVASSLDVLSDKVKDATKSIKDVGKDIGFDTSGIESKSKTVTTAIDGISTAAANAKTGLEQIKSGDAVGGLQSAVEVLKGLEGVGLPKDFATDMQVVATAAEKAKTSFEAFKSGDIAGGLKGAVDALKGLEGIGLPEGFANEMGTIADNFDKISKQVDPVTDGLKAVADMAPGTGLGELADKLGLIGDAIKIIVTLQPELAKLDDYIAQGTNLPLNLTPLENLRNILIDINNQRPGSPRFGGTPAGPQPSHPYVPGGPGRAGGGGISGPGGPKSDIIPIWASSGEHVLTAKDVAALGGQSGVYAFRNMLHMQGGGGLGSRLDPWYDFDKAPPTGQFNPRISLDPSMTHVTTRAEGMAAVAARRHYLWLQKAVSSNLRGGVLRGGDPPVGNPYYRSYAERSAGSMFAGGGAIEGINYAASISGKPYIYGGVGPGGFDCSGAQSAVFAALTGRSQGTRYFNTESNFEALGFQKGYMAGAYNIGISRGGGGKLSHMGATLPNGVTFEAGGANRGVMYGDGARGANTFPLQYYLPIAGGDPSSGAAGAGAAGGGGGGGGAGGGGGGGGGAGGLSDNPMRALQQLGEQQNALDTAKAEQVKKLLPDFGQLADIVAGGIKETLLPPGFSDPTQWKSTKSIGALLGWIGGLTGDPAAASILGGIGAGITGSGSGLYSGIMGAIPQPFGNLAPTTADQYAPGQYAPGAQAAGLPPGPAPPGINIGTLNDNSGTAVNDLKKTEKFNTTGQAMALRNMVRG